MVSNYINYFSDKFKEIYKFDIGTSEEVEVFEEKHFNIDSAVIFTFRKLEPTIENKKISTPLIIYVEVAEELAQDVMTTLDKLVMSLDNTTAELDLGIDVGYLEVVQNFNLSFLQQAHIESDQGFKDLYVINCTLSHSIGCTLALSNDCDISINGETIEKECLLNFGYDEQVIGESYVYGINYQEVPTNIARTFKIELLIKKGSTLFDLLVSPSAVVPPDVTISFQPTPTAGTFSYTVKRKALSLVNSSGQYLRASLTFSTYVNVSGV